MRAMNLLVAVFALSTQGCASMLHEMDSGYGSRFGEIRSDRPAVADALRGGQTALPGFGAIPNHRSVPQSLPLPIQTNRRAMFAVPSLGKHSITVLFGTMLVVNEVGCALAEAYDGTCEGRSNRDLERTIPLPKENKGPVILR